MVYASASLQLPASHGSSLGLKISSVHTRKSLEHDSTNEAVSGDRLDKDTSAGSIDPRAFGLAKAAYAVGEILDLLSIGRTSLYAPSNEVTSNASSSARRRCLTLPTLPRF